MTAVELWDTDVLPMSVQPTAPPAFAPGAFAGLPEVGLDELATEAALLTRVDRKYVLPTAAVAELARLLPEGTRRLVIDGRDDFRYRSLYFDTPELAAFHQAAGRRRRRFKVRTRSYCDTGDHFLEVKTRGSRGSTVKQRQELADPDRIDGGLPFVREALALGGVPVPAELDLLPTLVTRYHRTTLYLPDGERATVDSRLVWADPPANGPAGRTDLPGHPTDRRVALTGRVVVETKSPSGAGRLDHALWRLGHRPTRISKYATGLLVLDPRLTGRPWRRTVRRIAGPDPRSA